MIRSHFFLHLILALSLGLASSNAVRAQGGEPVELDNLSLEECIEYAITRSLTMANARLDNEIAYEQVGEVRSQGLPQVNANLQLSLNYKVQQAFFPDFIFPDPSGNAPPPNFDNPNFVPVPLQPKYSGQGQAELTQMVFDGAYFLGLKAAKTYTELSQKSIEQNAIEVAEAVSKAYYSVLVNRERLALLEKNSNRLDTLYRQTKALYETGFAEKIDADRIKVTLNNINTQKRNFERILEVSMQILKFQMGLYQDDKITISGSLRDLSLDREALLTDLRPEPQKRIEYSILNVQRELNQLQTKNIEMQYLPKLTFFATYGANTAAQTFSDFANVGDRWFGFGALGVRLQVPIFDGFRKKYQIQANKLEYRKIQNQMKDFERSVHFQVNQTAVELLNNIETLESQKENMELAAEIFRVAQIKYKEGLGSNLEVLDAETSYKEAETNYYAALYDAVITKIELEKAKGTLYPRK
ncbi:MAG: TolC family protein [Bernardetiaceae bacterium]|nr:TolC family protein [Bernardetiaceae bacterium]